MNSTSRPKTIFAIIILLIVLALVSGTSLATTRNVLNGANRRQGNGNTQGNANNNGNFQGNNGGTQGGTDGANNGGNNTGNNAGNNANSQRRGNQGIFNLFGITRSLGLNFQVIQYVSLGFQVLGIVLLLLSAYGVWKQQKWGLNLGMLLAFVFLLGALPALFSLGGRTINWLRTGLNLTSLAASLPVLALSMLPSVRDYFPRPKRKVR
jgi:hypothetical protein